MAFWGRAYAAGPNYNMPWVLYDSKGRAEALAEAYDATQAALARLDGLTDEEAALIRALTARYPLRDPSDDMAAWDHAFADAMRDVHKAHPEDADIATIFVDA